MGRVSLTVVGGAVSEPRRMQRYCACHQPAMFHVFRAKTLICECGKGWFSHQQNPSPCVSAVPETGIAPDEFFANPEVM